jgi:tetratricopeptide (TPR) repeat protein
MCYTHRRIFAQLATELMKEGKKDKALKVVEKIEKEIPAATVPHNHQGGSLELAQVYLDCGKKKQAADIASAVAENASEYCRWFTSLSDRRLQMSAEDCYYYLLQLSNSLKILDEADKAKAAKFEVALNNYFEQFQNRANY